MRILHLVHQYLPTHIGGTELYTQAVARGQSRRGHWVSIFCRGDGPGTGLNQRAEDGVQVYTADSGPLTPGRRFRATFGDGGLERAFERVLGEASPDVIHVEHLMGLPVGLAGLARRSGVPYVITLWDYWWVCANAQLLTNYDERICAGPRAFVNCGRCAVARAGHPQGWPAIPLAAPALALRNRLLAGVVESAARLIAPTEFVRRWYVEHGFPANRLGVLLPALDDVELTDIADPGAGHPVRFLYIGGLSWQKGVHVLVEAARGLNGLAEVWIAGDERADPAYAAQLRAQAAGNVRFLGRLDRSQVWATLVQADVAVVPTLWYETFSFIVSEAFMVGRPVIASRLGPLADRIVDGVNGVLVEAGDVNALRCAMQRFVDDPGHRACLRAGVQPPATLTEHLVELEAVYAS